MGSTISLTKSQEHLLNVFKNLINYNEFSHQAIAVYFFEGNWRMYYIWIDSSVDDFASKNRDEVIEKIEENFSGIWREIMIFSKKGHLSESIPL